MPKTAISVEHLTKRYDLGVINTGTLSKDINRWWARLRSKPDPYQKIGQPDHGNRKGDSLLALNDVSFQVQQGEALGIIGHNGAGKSTLLKILSRVTAPTSGKVKMNGRVGSLLEVGTGFHPELTGRENIYLNGAILGMSRKEVDRKLDEIVDFSGVEQFIDTPVKRYSSGMYVRLAFAVAAHLESEILIVDEVLAVGDAEFQKKCLGKMGDVAGEGRTILFVSHNMTAIESLCQRVCLINSGRINQNGSPHVTINKYLNRNPELGIIKKVTKKITFLGTKFQEFKIDENLLVELFFRTNQQNLTDVVINIAILNSENLKVIRLQSDLVESSYSLKAETEYNFSFRIDAPYLASGQYYLEIYMKDQTGNIFWAQNIHAFNIDMKTQQDHKKIFYDQIGVIMPKFSLTCHQL